MNNLEEAVRELERLKAEIEQNDKLFLWLLGYYDFPMHGDKPGAYYWRTPLREKLYSIGFDPDEVYEALTTKETKG